MKLRHLLPAVAVGAVFLIAGFSRLIAADPTPRPIDVIANRFSYNPGEITLKKGAPVVISFRSTDVAHGIRFKELGVETKFDKNKSGQLAFTPMQTGDFVGHCSVFCGSGHGSMILTIHVTE